MDFVLDNHIKNYHSCSCSQEYWNCCSMFEQILLEHILLHKTVNSDEIYSWTLSNGKITSMCFICANFSSQSSLKAHTDNCDAKHFWTNICFHIISLINNLKAITKLLFVLTKPSFNQYICYESDIYFFNIKFHIKKVFINYHNLHLYSCYSTCSP